MNQRDIREHTLEFKLKRIAAKLNIDERDLLNEAKSLGMFRDAREAADEFHININRVPTEQELRETVQHVIRTELQL